MTAIALFSTTALCVLVALWALEKAFSTAKYYEPMVREPKKISYKVGPKIYLTTTRGGEQ